MSDDPGLIGDNSRAMRRALLEEARAAAEPFIDRRQQFVSTMAKYVVIRDRQDVANAGDLIGMARDVFDRLDAKRKDIVVGPNDAIDAVNALFREFWAPVENQVLALRDKLDAFAQAEKTRIEEQQDEQRRHEQALRGPAPPPAAPAPTSSRRAERKPRRQNVRGDYGSNVVFGEVDVIEIEDWRELPDFIMFAGDVRTAIIKVARPHVKQQLKIPGLKVTKAAATTVRR